jgi:hypothetical protein
MFLKAFRTASFAILAIATTAWPSTPGAARDIGSFEGAWEGRLKVVAGTNEDSDSYKRAKARYEESPFKIIVREQRASVYFGDREVKPASFQTRIHMSNAVVFASDTGEDQDGRWVETWNFTLTRKNPETLIVCFSRVVNDLDAPEASDSRFFYMAAGELGRTSP